MKPGPSVRVVERPQALLPSSVFLEISRAVLSEGHSFRFQATGGSMLPFIHQDDMLTVAPLGARQVRLGDVMAFVHPRTATLAVHRVTRRRGDEYLLSGDAVQMPDGWVSRSEILGRVVRIERNGRPVHLGLGMERILIAWLRRHEVLWESARRMGRPLAALLR